MRSEIIRPAMCAHSNCNIDGDGDIDVFELIIAAGNHGERW